MKKTVKVALWTILSPIALFIFLVLLFYFPPFQNWAVKQVTAIASEKTGMEITVEHVHLAFPLDLSVEGVTVIKPADETTQQSDTVAIIKHTVVDVQLLPLFGGNVEIDKLSIQNILFNTTDFIESASVNGTAKEINLESHGIDLSTDKVMLNYALLSNADINVVLKDFVPEDTITAENNWVIVLQKLQVRNSKVAIHMPGDTLQVRVFLGDADVTNSSFDLGKSAYRVEALNLKQGKIQYDNNAEAAIPGFDYNHLSFTDVNIASDSIGYVDDELYANIRTIALKEKCGFELSGLRGSVKMNSTNLTVPMLTAITPFSHAQMSANVDFAALIDSGDGNMNINAKASVGKDDLLLFMADMPSIFCNKWPNENFDLDVAIDGNMQYLNVNSLTLCLPTVFDVNAEGQIKNLLETEKLFANINLKASTYNTDFLLAAVNPALTKTIRIPSGTKAIGNLQAIGTLYKADLNIIQGRGRITLKGNYDTAFEKYHADIVSKSFPLQKYVIGMGLSPFTGDIHVIGRGMDFMSKATHLQANAYIDSFAYDNYDLSGTHLSADMKEGKTSANLDCVNNVLDGSVAMEALTDKKILLATVDCTLNNADLQAMNLVDGQLTTSLKAHLDIATDMDELHEVTGIISDVAICDSSTTYRPEPLHLNITTNPDTTIAVAHSGDFDLDMKASGGYKRLLTVAVDLTTELTSQIVQKYISQNRIRQLLPNGHLSLHSGKNNFVARFTNRMDYYFREVNVDLTSSPETGLNGTMEIDSLYAYDMQLDKIYLNIITDDDVFKYRGQIENEKDNPQYVFNALFDGSVFETGTDCNVHLYDSNEDLGLKLGLRATIEEDGVRLKLNDTNTILGYRPFVANNDNYFFISNDNRVSAYMKLLADDGTGIHIYSDDENLDALQDITLGVNHLDLSSLISVIPYCPNIGGVLDGDFHVIQTTEELSVSTSLGIDDLTYDGCSMGDMATEFVYIPLEDGGHYVDGIIMHDGNEVGTIKGTYTPDEEQSRLDAKLALEEIPLNLVNAFIPDQIIGLNGFGDGILDIDGPLNKLQVNGEVDLRDAKLTSVPYGIEMRFDNRPVKIVNGRLTLENFNMYSRNSQPLVMNGYIDFSNLDRMNIDMRMKAKNFLLIDSKQNRKSETFGKAYVNVDATMTGFLEAIQMKGNVDVLGTTDMTYVLRDSPLTTDNRLDELVQFVDFSDESSETVARPAIEGLNMDLQIAIDQGAHIVCALNETKSNYLDLLGGGNLRMLYKNEEITLNGRYTLTNGEMKYSLPVIPLKTFNIQNGSYVEFTGEVFNPTLNITAVERTKATVSDGTSNRSVDFDCGVVITKTLEDMGLEFTIDAPEDMALHSELLTMSIEERGKLAVTMLTTGMYLSDNNLSSVTMNSALSSYLQSEINSITGNALRTLDLSIGLDNSTDATGTLHTDYSFKFAKRFWNNKVSVVVGGKVSTDDAMNQSLFDNVALEYRLDQSANTNMKLFYDHAVYDYLEGYVGQYGAGLVWKRKIQSLRDLFPRKSKKPRLTQEQPQAPDIKKGDDI